jgi:hypothetical protein
LPLAVFVLRFSVKVIFLWRKIIVFWFQGLFVQLLGLPSFFVAVYWDAAVGGRAGPR